jgi:putative ABC transport system permease protein
MALHPVLSALLRSKTTALLVVVQVALTLAIVSNALFVVRDRLATSSRPSGLDEASVFQLVYAGAGELQDRAAMQQRDREVLAAIPGVRAVAGVNSFPLSQSGWNMGLAVDPAAEGTESNAAAYFSGESLIDSWGLRLVEGRDFEPAEVREVDPRTGDLEADAVILTRALARRMFPDDATVVGKTVYLGIGADAPALRVVGVVDTVMTSSAPASSDAHASFLLPIRYLSNGVHYAVRTEPAQRARVMAEAEKALSALRDDRVLIRMRSMDEIRARRYREERAGAGLLIAVVVGLVLVTAGGIVGVSSLWVNQRRKQIGIRRALGARRLDILLSFVGENLLLTTTGIVLGVGLTLGLNHYLVSRVELARLPATYLLVGVLAAWVLGVLAVLGPAWRAASVPPAIATRTA